MTKDELIEFLRNHLKIKIEADHRSFVFDTTEITVSIILDMEPKPEILSTDSISIRA